MNRIYRLVWNAALGLWVAVAENAKGRSKSGSTRSSVDCSSVHEGNGGHGGDGGSGASSGFTLNAACRAAAGVLACLTFLASPQAHAADAANASVVAGAGTVATAGNVTTITQATQKLAIDWTSLSTRANEALVFNQPNAQAIALNRITGSSPSELLGSLTANGQVFILNPNGVLFGAGSQVNVGGLVASTLSMSNADFMSGNHVFTNSGGTGSVVNQGTMTAAQGGYLALLAPEVRNEGVMVASLSTALLAAGNKVTLNLDNGSLLGYSIDQGAINALAENKQLIKADGGQVLLSARAMDSLTTATVNNTGIIEARTIQNKSGRIMLMGDMAVGQVNVGGTLDASAPNGGDGGFIETSAAHVNVAAGTQVTTLAVNGNSGGWLIDPVDFTIAATGGNITGATLGSNLGSGNVTILSTSGTTGTLGDVNVNDAVTWSANKLTLNAQNNININANLNGSGTAQLALEYGQSSAAGSGTSYKLNNGAKVSLPAGNNFSTKQGSSGTTLAWRVINSLGSASSITVTDLQGITGGLGGLYVLGADIDAAATSSWNAGLGFAPIGNYTTPFTGSFDGLGHTVSNLVINRPTMDYVGLFGYTGNGTVIRNVGLVGGSVSGRNNVGWLVGSTNGGSISNAYATGSVTGSGDYVGGLVGATNGSISNAYASGSVTGSGNFIGGLVGQVVGGSISNAYASGSVGGNNTVGGLVGYNFSGSISNAYASGSVTGSGGYVGGLVGYNTGSISNAYATGSVTGSSNVGGLVGQVGGGTVTNSYWDITTTGQASSAGGTGFTNANGFTQSTYSGFDFGATWWMSNFYTRPFLRSEYSTTINNAHQLQLVAMNATTLGASYTLGSNLDMTELSRVSSMWDTSSGFVPIGRSSSTQFTGSFDGLGHTVSNLVINRPTADLLGLFGYTGNGSVIRNVGLVGGSVTGHNTVGGLVGWNNGIISNAYASGSVTGSGATGGASGPGGYVGGLVGYNAGSISNAYATGSVTGTGDFVGGLVGYNAGSISNAYATGSVTGSSNVGGLVGQVGGGVVTNSYWDTETSGQLSSTGGTGRTTVQMKQLASFTGWDIDAAGGTGTVWRIYEGNSGPLLRSFLTQLTVANASTTYNGTTQTGTVVPTSGTLSGTAASGRNAGTYSAAYYSNQQGYDISGGALTIDKANLTVSTSDVSKTYDGGFSAIGTATATIGTVYVGDTLTGGSFAFTDKNAGISNKTVTVTGVSVSDGNSGNNYNVTYADNTSSTITAKALTYSTTAANKTYNGNNVAAATLSGLTGLVSTEMVTASAGATFNTKDVLTANLVTVNSATLADGSNGGLASNYSIAAGGTAAASITAKALTYSTTAADKTYNGNNVAAATLSGLTGLVDTETLTASSTGATFNTKDVATANLVTVNSATLADGSNGGLASNYSIAAGGTAAASITAKALTYSTTAANKTYNGNNVAGATLSGLTGLVSTEIVTASSTGATFNTKDVATANLVTVNSATLADGSNGGLASNYSIAGGGTAAASITAKALTYSTAAVNKTYDGNTTAAATLSGLTGLVSTETVTASSTGATFNTKDVLTANLVTVNSATLADGSNGGLASNYSIAAGGTAAASITPKALTVSGVTANNKTYDQTTAATVSTSGAVYGGLIAGDVLAVNATGTFTDKNVANGKTVNLTSGYTGADVGNYTITDQATTLANITPKALTVSGVTANNKTYDQTTAATVSTSGAVYGGLIAGDVLAVNATGTFTDKNVANGKTVNLVSGYTGADVGNYTITDQASTTANITPKALTVSGVTASNKIYDQTTAATVSTSGAVYGGLIAGDVLAVNATGTFTDKNVANGKTVNLTSGYTGADVGNYAITDQATTTANITPKALTVSGVTASNKTYDQTTAATVSTSGAVYGGLIAGDVLAVNATGVFADKNAATGKTVNLTSGYTGADVGNYAITDQATATADITPKALTYSTTAANKTYNGNNVATATLSGLTGLVSTETVTASSTGATFNTKDVATANLVTVNSATLADGSNGGLASNYSIAAGGTAAASITPAALLITANNDSRVAPAPYSGGNGVVYSGLVGGETAGVLGGALTYGGSSQGASAAGSYAITPGGYSAGNYAISYANGVLSMAPAVQAVTSGGSAEAALGGPALVTAYGGALQAVGGLGVSAGGSGGGAGAGAGGSRGGDAGALAAAATTATDTGEE